MIMIFKRGPLTQQHYERAARKNPNSDRLNDVLAVQLEDRLNALSADGFELVCFSPEGHLVCRSKAQ